MVFISIRWWNSFLLYLEWKKILSFKLTLKCSVQKEVKVWKLKCICTSNSFFPPMLILPYRPLKTYIYQVFLSHVFIYITIMMNAFIYITIVMMKIELPIRSRKAKLDSQRLKVHEAQRRWSDLTKGTVEQKKYSLYKCQWSLASGYLSPSHSQHKKLAGVGALCVCMHICSVCNLHFHLAVG